MTRRKKGDAEAVIESDLDSSNDIQKYQLLAIKHALKLEEKGLVPSGRRTRLQPAMAVKLGLNRAATYKTIYREIDKRIGETS